MGPRWRMIEAVREEREGEAMECKSVEKIGVEEGVKTKCERGGRTDAMYRGVSVK
jgi:hypothetical protein